jgi:hypothetical protein
MADGLRPFPASERCSLGGILTLEKRDGGSFVGMREGGLQGGPIVAEVAHSSSVAYCVGEWAVAS